jgi:hypothetical protein
MLRDLAPAESQLRRVNAFACTFSHRREQVSLGDERDVEA